MGYRIVYTIYRIYFRKSSPPEISRKFHSCALSTSATQLLWNVLNKVSDDRARWNISKRLRKCKTVKSKCDFVWHEICRDKLYSNSPLDTIQGRKQTTKILPTANTFIYSVLVFVYNTKFGNYRRTNGKNLQPFLAVRYRRFCLPPYISYSTRT